MRLLFLCVGRRFFSLLATLFFSKDLLKRRRDSCVRCLASGRRPIAVRLSSTVLVRRVQRAPSPLGGTIINRQTISLV